MRSLLSGQKSEDKGPENQSQEPSHTSAVINTQNADNESPDNSFQVPCEDERRNGNTENGDKERRSSLQERAKRLIEDTNRLIVDNSRSEIASTFSKISPISTNPATGFQDLRNDRISRNPSAGMFFICVSPFVILRMTDSHSPHVIIVSVANAWTSSAR